MCKKMCTFAQIFETMTEFFLQTDWLMLLTKILLATALGYCRAFSTSAGLIL